MALFSTLFYDFFNFILLKCFKDVVVVNICAAIADANRPTKQ